MTGTERDAPQSAQKKGVIRPQPKAGPLPQVRTGSAAGEALLYSDLDEQELQARLSDGDPLSLYERGVRKAREEAVLVDGERLFDRVLACIVTRPRPENRAHLGTWIDSALSTAIADILREDSDRLGSPESDAPSPSHVFIEEAFGVEAPRALAAAVVFNGLPDRARTVFVALLVEDRTPTECMEAGLGGAESLRALALKGLDALMINGTPQQAVPARMSDET